MVLISVKAGSEASCNFHVLIQPFCDSKVNEFDVASGHSCFHRLHLPAHWGLSSQVAIYYVYLYIYIHIYIYIYVYNLILSREYSLTFDDFDFPLPCCFAQIKVPRESTITFSGFKSRYTMFLRSQSLNSKALQVECQVKETILPNYR